MVDGTIQLPADSTGKILDTSDISFGVGATSRHRERVVLGDPTSTTGLATVTSSAGLLANLSSGTVTLSSAHVVSLSSGTVTLSSSPTVISASSGLIQISGTPAITSTSVLLTTGSVISLSSGTVTLSSNPTVISASSGLVQISGTVTVLSASSGLVQLSGTPTVTATAGTNPWSSAPGFNMPVVSVSSGLVQISGVPTVGISSTLPATGKFIVATSVSKVTSSASTLWGYVAFTTVATGAVIRFYNATTSNVVMNTGVVAASPVSAQSTVADWGAQTVFGPRGFNFATACSFDVVLNATSTLAVAGQCFVTALVN